MRFCVCLYVAGAWGEGSGRGRRNKAPPSVRSKVGGKGAEGMLKFLLKIKRDELTKGLTNLS